MSKRKAADAKPEGTSGNGVVAQYNPKFDRGIAARTTLVEVDGQPDPREVKKLRIFCARGVKLCLSKNIKILKIPPKWAAVAARNGIKQIDGITLAQ